MDRKTIRIETLLKKYNRLSPEVKTVNLHMDILEYDARTLLARLSSDGIIEVPSDLSEEKLAEVVSRLINKCNAASPEYDSKMDEELTRIGMNTDRPRYVNDRTISSKNNRGGLYGDDGSGNGSELPTAYEDFMDIQYEDGRFK